MAQIVSSTAPPPPDDGGIFNGTTFFISHQVPSLDHWKKFIQANGGKITIYEQNANIKIGDSAKSKLFSDKGFICWKFLDDCQKEQRLVDADDSKYAITGASTPLKRKSTGKTVGGTTTKKSHTRSRNFFTDEEDLILFEKLAVSAKLSGFAVYQELEAEHPNHSYHGWRGRWIDRYAKENGDPVYWRDKYRAKLGREAPVGPADGPPRKKIKHRQPSSGSPGTAGVIPPIVERKTVSPKFGKKSPSKQSRENSESCGASLPPVSDHHPKQSNQRHSPKASYLSEFTPAPKQPTLHPDMYNLTGTSSPTLPAKLPQKPKEDKQSKVDPLALMRQIRQSTPPQQYKSKTLPKKSRKSTPLPSTSIAHAPQGVKSIEPSSRFSTSAIEPLLRGTVISLVDFTPEDDNLLRAFSCGLRRLPASQQQETWEDFQDENPHHSLRKWKKRYEELFGQVGPSPTRTPQQSLQPNQNTASTAPPKLASPPPKPTPDSPIYEPDDVATDPEDNTRTITIPRYPTTPSKQPAHNPLKRKRGLTTDEIPSTPDTRYRGPSEELGTLPPPSSPPKYTSPAKHASAPKHSLPPPSSPPHSRFPSPTTTPDPDLSIPSLPLPTPTPHKSTPNDLFSPRNIARLRKFHHDLLSTRDIPNTRITYALYCASGNPRIAEQVLDCIDADRPVERINGVWTPEMDRVLIGTDAKEVEKLAKRKGRWSADRRLAWLAERSRGFERVEEEWRRGEEKWREENGELTGLGEMKVKVEG